MRKAFDSANNKQLLKSLERSGIKSYLTNRKQIVKTITINGTR